MNPEIEFLEIRNKKLETMLKIVYDTLTKASYQDRILLEQILQVIVPTQTPTFNDIEWAKNILKLDK